MDEVADLLVRFGVADGGIELDAHEVRHVQPDGPCQLAGEPLGDEGPWALAGSAELDDIQAVIVGLDEPGREPPSRNAVT